MRGTTSVAFSSTNWQYETGVEVTANVRIAGVSRLRIEVKFRTGLLPPAEIEHLGCDDFVADRAADGDSAEQQVQPTLLVIGHAAVVCEIAGPEGAGQLQLVSPRQIWARRTVAANIKRPNILTVLIKYTPIPV